MDLPDDDFDQALEAELDDWLRKEAAKQDMDPNDPYAGELDVIKRFQQHQAPEDFEWLYNAHKPLIADASRRYAGSSTLPKAAIRGFAMQRYAHALQTYDPGKAQFKTHLFNEMRRLGRYNAKYSNIARVAEDRGGLIGLLQQVEPNLREKLGRDPTNDELSDEMTLAAQDVTELKKKLKHISPKNIGTLRKELRPDYMLEAPRPNQEGDVGTEEDSEYRRMAVFLHGSLNPEQQLVLEHSYEGFGKPVIPDDTQLAQTLNMSPQKVRALKSQIDKRVRKHYRP